jgi:23S rRNA A2030 N6-methylase RlmJ
MMPRAVETEAGQALIAELRALVTEFRQYNEQVWLVYYQPQIAEGSGSPSIAAWVCAAQPQDEVRVQACEVVERADDILPTAHRKVQYTGTERQVSAMIPRVRRALAKLQRAFPLEVQE